ncbi:MAG: phage tail tape measure protein [Nitrospirae bacterium]|nr:phage tail tape measure protein [Nitrospirota bacterium]
MSNIGKSLPDLADGLDEIISAGIKTKDALIILETASKAAVAGSTSTSTSAKIITEAMNAYKLPAKDAGNVSDILFTAMQQGKMVFNELANSMSPLLHNVAELIIPLKDLAAALATLKQSGHSLPEASKELNTIFESILAKNDVFKAAGHDVSKDFEEHGLKGGLTEIDKIQKGNNEDIKQNLPDKEKIHSAMSLIGDNVNKFTENLEGMEKAVGAANIAFTKMADTTQHNIDIFKAQAEVFDNQFQDKILPPLASLAKI